MMKQLSAEEKRLLKISKLLSYCEEIYVKVNVEAALRCAVAVASAYPDVPQPYAHVSAYRMLHSAAKNRTLTGEPDWCAMLGITRKTSTSESIQKRYLEIMELLDGEKRTFLARVRVSDLITRAMAELTNEDKRRAYNLRSGFDQYIIVN